MASWFWSLWLLILCHYIAPETQGARAPSACAPTSHAGPDTASPICGRGDRALFGGVGHCLPTARRPSLSKCATRTCKGHYPTRPDSGDACLRQASAVALRDVPAPEQRKSGFLRWLWVPLAESYVLVGLGQSSSAVAATTGSVAVTGIAKTTEITEETCWQGTTGAGSACGKGCAASPPADSTNSAGVACTASNAYPPRPCGSRSIPQLPKRTQIAWCFRSWYKRWGSIRSCCQKA